MRYRDIARRKHHADGDTEVAAIESTITARARAVKARAQTDSITRDVRIRVIRPTDWRKLQRFHDRLSLDTIENRFHGAKRALSEPLAHRFTQMDGTDNVAFVATKGSRGRIVGVARYSRLSPVSAEVAFVIEDHYQGHHIGSRLMKRLKSSAVENGIREFVAEVLPGNVPMLKLMHEAGKTRSSYRDGECHVLVDLLAS
jgi:RimJ/RimL family protein N-acetyltransferase